MGWVSPSKLGRSSVQPHEHFCPVLIGTRENHRACALSAGHVREQDGERVLVCHFHAPYGRRLPFRQDELSFYAEGRLVQRSG
jgi:hypothetical protein